MKKIILFSVVAMCVFGQSKFVYDRLSPDNAAFLFLDHQTGLVNGIEDQSLP
jgi:hypothetical protein